MLSLINSIYGMNVDYRFNHKNNCGWFNINILRFDIKKENIVLEEGGLWDETFWKPLL